MYRHVVDRGKLWTGSYPTRHRIIKTNERIAEMGSNNIQNTFVDTSTPLFHVTSVLSRLHSASPFSRGSQHSIDNSVRQCHLQLKCYREGFHCVFQIDFHGKAPSFRNFIMLEVFSLNYCRIPSIAKFLNCFHPKNMFE